MRGLIRELPDLLVGFIIVLLGLLFFGLFLLVLSLQVPGCAGTITNATSTASLTRIVASSASTGTKAASPTLTPTPTLSDKITTCADKTNKALTSILLFLVNFLSILIVILLGPFLIWRIWRLSQVSNLVIDTFNNSTGNADLDKVLSGLNQLTRQNLVPVIEGVRQRIITYRDQGPGKYDPSDQSPPPATNVDQSLNNLLASLKGVPSAGPLQTALQLMSLLFTSRGIKVSITLQKRGDTPQIFGISLEVTDLQSRQGPKLFTFWEPSPPPKTVSDDKSSNWLYKLIPLLETIQSHPAKKQVPDVVKTPEDRFLTLLRPATRWLAIELTRRSMVAQMPRIRRWEIKHYCSRVYNFIGDFYQSSFLEYYHYADFGDMATNNFKLSIETDKEWFQPYENLADTYIIQVKGERSISGKTDKELLYQAISRYNQASEHYRRKEVLMVTVMRRLGISTAIAQLLTGDSDLIGEAKDLIEKIVSQETLVGGQVPAVRSGNAIANDTMKLVEEIPKIEHTWQLDSEKDGQLLYNLALWYGISKSMPEPGFPDAKLLARRYLIYSLVRDDSLWDMAISDSSFVDVFTDDEFGTLKTIISRKMCEVPALQKEEGPEFERHINEIANKIPWKG